MIRDLFDKIVHHRAFVPASIGVGSVSAGLGVGYVLGCKITEKRMLAIFARVMEEEDAKREEEESFVDPNQLEINFNHPAARLHAVPDHEDDESTDGATESPVVLEHKPDIVPPRTNVFRVADADWDQNSEEVKRTEDAPYIISKDEFFAEERKEEGYLQDDMIYYAGDDILTDSSDVPQYDHERMVGDLQFGHGSGEDNVVYVRNPMLKMEWMISRDPGSYEHEVLGDQLQE